MPARIGIYGGSFNPIHSGHVGVALRAARELALDKVLVVPAKTSPFKTGLAGESRMFSDAQRWEMAVAACAPHPVLEPCSIELGRGGVSYTIDTVRAIAAANPGAELFFIIGDDSRKDLHLWKDWETLRTLAKFVSYPRTRESSTEIRRRMAAGESIAEFVPAGVAALIAAYAAKQADGAR